MKEEFVRVASKSDAVAVSRAIAAIVRKQGFCTVYAIGAGPVNIAAKAIAISRGNLAPAGHDIICTPAFEQKMVNGEEKTVFKFIVEPRF